MTHTADTPRPPSLPEQAQHIVSDLLSGKFLGASRNIRQINDLFVCIAQGWNTNSASELVATLRATGDYLAATRGRNTPAIGNAIRLFLKGIDSHAASTVSEVRQAVETRRDDFNALSLKNADLIADYGANVLAECNTIMAFDYSSSQLAILRRLAERGRHLHVIVPESRTLDGGRPIAQEASGCGHHVTFVVDMAFDHFLRRCEAVLIGAETITADGASWNTVGSYPIALLSDMYRVPYYVATELIKIAPDSFVGVRRPIKLHDYSNLLDHPGSFERPDLVTVMAPDLDIVPASLITAYITPVGVILPAHLWSEARRLLDEPSIVSR